MDAIKLATTHLVEDLAVTMECDRLQSIEQAERRDTERGLASLPARGANMEE